MDCNFGLVLDVVCFGKFGIVECCGEDLVVEFVVGGVEGWFFGNFFS